MTELKPCPFCGGDERIIDRKYNGWTRVWEEIKCTQCNATMSGCIHNGENPDKISDRWNRRAGDND